MEYASDSAYDVRDRLETIKKILFSNVSNIYVNNVLAPPTEPADQSYVCFRNVKDLDAVLDFIDQDGERHPAMKIILIPQEYSWGRLKITSLMFSEIMRRWRVGPGFLDIVGAYGLKTNEDERNFYGWRESGARHEVCYNVPHVERHGRDLRDPWSLRQTAFYHQHSRNTEASRWIVLNASPRTRATLDRFLASDTRCCSLAVHTQLLTMLGSNWMPYVEDLTVALLEQDNKASYSSIDKLRDHGFTVTYHDLQELHMLQAKIDRASVAIDACVQIGRSCSQHFEGAAECPTASRMPCQSCLDVLGVYVSDMARHSQTLRRLDRRLKGVLDLISKVLMFRNEVLLQNFNRHSGDTLDALLAINQQSRVHQATLTQLFATAQADSVLLKILSIVATVYLPASLIATVFSSNLIQSATVAATQGSQRLVLSPQFWT
ncbi:hypothetical protein B0A55_06036, partial [Friedmanniomyces simplex]